MHFATVMPIFVLHMFVMWPNLCPFVVSSKVILNLQGFAGFQPVASIASISVLLFMVNSKREHARSYSLWQSWECYGLQVVVCGDLVLLSLTNLFHNDSCERFWS